MNDSFSWKRLLSRFKSTAPPEEHCFWAVDIHSHLIPGIDDGVKNPQQALTCLKQLAEWGIQKIITTPHISGDRYPTSIETVEQGKQLVQKLITEHQLPLTAEVAAEYLIDDYFHILLQNQTLLTFGAKKYLLIETGWAAAPNQLDDILFQIQAQGYTPVLAHPERYNYYHGPKNRLLQLHEKGCLFQLNWMSLTGRYGTGSQKQARFLLEERLVDFIGSDLHRPQDLEKMAALFNARDINLLRNQPLLNESLRYDAPAVRENVPL